MPMNFELRIAELRNCELRIAELRKKIDPLNHTNKFEIRNSQFEIPQSIH